MTDPADPGFRLSAVILAAGASTRMGSPKQLLPVDGRPLVARAADAALESGAWPVIVVLGAWAERIRPALARLPVVTVENPEWAEGMASSVRAGLAALRQFERSLDGVLVAPCDLPAFSAQTVEKLAAAQRATGRSIAAARYSGRCGAPAVFLKVHFPALATLTGEEGARLFLNADPGRVAAVDLPEMAADLDTPEDYRKFTAASP